VILGELGLDMVAPQIGQPWKTPTSWATSTSPECVMSFQTVASFLMTRRSASAKESKQPQTSADWVCVWGESPLSR